MRRSFNLHESSSTFTAFPQGFPSAHSETRHKPHHPLNSEPWPFPLWMHWIMQHNLLPPDQHAHLTPLKHLWDIWNWIAAPFASDLRSLICIETSRCSQWCGGLQPHHPWLVSSRECLTFSFPFHPSTLPLPPRCSCSPCPGHLRWDSACLPLAV